MIALFSTSLAPFPALSQRPLDNMLPPGGAYAQAGLATIAPRFGIPFLGADDKDAIRDSIMRGRHLEEFGDDPARDQQRQQ